MTDDEKVAAVDKALGEPYLAEFSDDALRVRRNLLIVSLIAVVGAVFNVRIAPDSPLFGFHLVNISDQALRVGMMITVAYLLIHFAWYALDSLTGWRIRVTGTRLTYLTAGIFGHEELDYPSDIRQSTLYNWWKMKRHALGTLNDRMVAVEESVKNFTSRLDDMRQPPNIIENSSNVVTGLNEIDKRLTELMHALTTIQGVDTSPRVMASLQRFDSWFSLWLKSQNLRWLVIDVSAPLVMGLIALFLLVHPLGISSMPPLPRH
jgi:hypothetical protein